MTDKHESLRNLEHGNLPFSKLDLCCATKLTCLKLGRSLGAWAAQSDFVVKLPTYLEVIGEGVSMPAAILKMSLAKS